MPTDADWLYQEGLAYAMSGRLPEAARAFAQVVQLRPEHAEAHNNLGVVQAAQGRLDEAAASYAAALRLVSDHVEAHNNLAVVLTERGRLDEAAAHAGEALRLRPGFAEAHYNLGNVLRQQGRFADAAERYRQAVLLRPHYPEAHNNLGLVLGQQGRFDDAAASYQQALAFQPGYSEAHNNLGVAFQALGRTGDAVRCFEEAVRLQPAFGDALSNLGNVYKDSGRVAEAIACYEKALALEPGNAAVHSNLLLALHYQPGVESHTLFAEHRRWGVVHAAPLTEAHPPLVADRTPGRRLRIGYVSGDFRQHPAASCLELVLAAHDRARFEVFCYSDVTRPDAVTERLRGHPEHWRSLVGLDDNAAVELLRADEIDLLVDLAGHTANHRLLVFARRPAPVQATFLGYPNTTGLHEMDYRITDAWSDPPGLTERYHSEELIRLPDISWCYRPPDEAADVSDLPALQTGRITFACLNNAAKVTEPALALWGRILAALPGARLLLLGGTGGTEDSALARNLCALWPAGGSCRLRRENQPRGILPPASDHRSRPGPVPVQRRRHDLRRAVDGCPHRWAGRRSLRGTAGAKLAVPPRPARVSRRVAGSLRGQRSRPGPRPAAPARDPPRPARADAAGDANRRATLHAAPRNGVPAHVGERCSQIRACPESKPRRTWQDIPGWFDFEDLYRRMVAEARPGAVFVEIGCWLGRSTAFLAQAIRDAGKDIRLYAVEHGFGSPGGADQRCYRLDLDRHGGTVAGALHRNLLECGVADQVVPILASSACAARLFAPGSVDFVFLDGDHRYNAVLDDLRLWWEKLRPGGVFAGHDYTVGWPEVVRAVHDFFGAERVVASGRSCWLVVRNV